MNQGSGLEGSLSLRAVGLVCLSVRNDGLGVKDSRISNV